MPGHYVQTANAVGSQYARKLTDVRMLFWTLDTRGPCHLIQTFFSPNRMDSLFFFFLVAQVLRS